MEKLEDSFFFQSFDINHDGNTLCIVIPKTVTSAVDLMQIIAEGLRFPENFGHNWNALFDCLCDLSWITERRVIIVHDKVPEIPAPHLKEYLHVLRDAVSSWQSPASQHDLLIYFPRGAVLPTV